MISNLLKASRNMNRRSCSQRALEIEEKVLPPDHPRIALTLEKYAQAVSRRIGLRGSNPTRTTGQGDTSKAFFRNLFEVFMMALLEEIQDFVDKVVRSGGVRN